MNATVFLSFSTCLLLKFCLPVAFFTNNDKIIVEITKPQIAYKFTTGIFLHLKSSAFIKEERANTYLSDRTFYAII